MMKVAYQTYGTFRARMRGAVHLITLAFIVKLHVLPLEIRRLGNLR